MNTQIKYIKSFSKGQITIPKEIRDTFGIGDNFWLKLSVQQGKIIAEPITGEKKINNDELREWLLTIPPLDIDINEIKENRKQIEKKLKSRQL
jgi:AbrB family looped-hinge helix DNA binding protein